MSANQSKVTTDQGMVGGEGDRNKQREKGRKKIKLKKRRKKKVKMLDVWKVKFKLEKVFQKNTLKIPFQKAKDNTNRMNAVH